MTGKSPLTDDQWARIWQRVQDGEEPGAIGTELGYSGGAVMKMLRRRYGYQPRPRQAPMSYEQSAAALERLSAGETAGAVARDLGVDKGNLYRLLERRHGWTASTRYRPLWSPTIQLGDKSATDLAYLAGIIDGEGSILETNRTQRFPTWVVKVNMTDEPVIRWMHTFGGTFSPRPAKIPGHKDQYEWKMHRQMDVQALLLAVLPYLRVKRGHADRALDAFQSQGAVMHDRADPFVPAGARDSRG